MANTHRRKNGSRSHGSSPFRLTIPDDPIERATFSELHDAIAHARKDEYADYLVSRRSR